MKPLFVFLAVVMAGASGWTQGFDSDLRVVLKAASELRPQGRSIAAIIDLNEPPFYMMNYAEVSDIQEDQRTRYFGDVIKHSKRMRALDSKMASETVSKDDLLEAMASEMDWKQLMTKISRACQDVRNEKSCERLMDARVKAFEMKGRQSLEDRQAAGRAHSTSQPTTRPPSK